MRRRFREGQACLFRDRNQTVAAIIFLHPSEAKASVYLWVRGMDAGANSREPRQARILTQVKGEDCREHTDTQRAQRYLQLPISPRASSLSRVFYLPENGPRFPFVVGSFPVPGQSVLCNIVPEHSLQYFLAVPHCTPL
jgi:hypothetical protein